MAAKRARHVYPKWMAWPIEVVAFLIVVPTAWHYIRVHLQIMFQQWPQTLAGLDLIPYVKSTVLQMIGTVPAGPVAWEGLYDSLLTLNIQVSVLFFLACLIRNFLPQLRLAEQGLQVRRGLGWATIPWDHITMVQTMNLPGDRLVLLIQGRRWRLGPWFRLYSLLWPSGLLKGIVLSWHISNFEALAENLVWQLQQVYGQEGIKAVVDDMAYSYPYALLFQPQTTWNLLFAKQQKLRDSYTHPGWLNLCARLVAGLLLLLATWRYLGVWWRFLGGRFNNLLSALRWPILGPLLRSFGPLYSISPGDPAQMRRAAIALILAQVSVALTLIAVIFILNFFPNWLLGADGVSVRFRKNWLAIPWRAICSIRETLFQRGGGVILIQTERDKLPFWNALYSLFYGAGLRRGVIFTSLLPGFEDLRQRIHLGIVRTYEQEESTPTQAILQEQGEAEFLEMMREPVAKLRRLAGQEPADGLSISDRLFRSPLRQSSEFAGDMPWDHDSSWTADYREEDEKVRLEERVQQGRALRAMLALTAFPMLLVFLEEALFPELSRPLALLSIGPISQGPNLLKWILLAVVVGLFALLEWPLAAGLMSLVEEMHSQRGDFKQALYLYPRIQSPILLIGVALLPLAATGLVQSLFLIWWGLGCTLWGAILLWLGSRELYDARGVTNILLVVGHVLYQGLVVLVYIAFH